MTPDPFDLPAGAEGAAGAGLAMGKPVSSSIEGAAVLAAAGEGLAGRTAAGLGRVGEFPADGCGGGGDPGVGRSADSGFVERMTARLKLDSAFRERGRPATEPKVEASDGKAS